MKTHPIIEALKAEGLKAKYECSTNGGEWHAACPFCRDETGDGGKDRFILWPEKGNFMCRRGHKGEIAEVLAKQADISLREARRRLDLPETQRRAFAPRRNIVESPKRWREMVAKIIRTRQKQLAWDECEKQRDYLAVRGLRPETIKAARLGGCHETRFYDREEFGLLPEVDAETDKPRKVCVPEGILIPYFDAAGNCVKLQSRCEGERYGRYRTIPGSEQASMILRPSGDVRYVVLVESALDCILCHQEVPEDFAFVALGAAGQGPDDDARALFDMVERVFVATDNDEAGADAFEDLSLRYDNMHRLCIPAELGKDVGEAFMNGMNIGDWCRNGVELAEAARRKHIRPVMRVLPKAKLPFAPQPAPAPAASAEMVIPPFQQSVPFTYVTSEKRAARAALGLRESKILAIDFETTPLPEHRDTPGAALDPRRSRPRLLQAQGDTEVYIFDLNHVPLASLAPLFDGPWVAHNAVFELTILLAAGLEPQTPQCTMLMDNALRNGLASLDDLCKHYLQYEMDKSQQSSDWSGEELSPEQLRYAALDVAAVRLLWQRLRKEVKRRDRKRLCDLLHAAQPAVALLQLNGLGFDAEAHAKLIRRWRKRHKEALATLNEFGGPENPNSHKQVVKFFREHATREQMKGWPRTEKGSLSTSAKEIAAYADIPAVAAYLDYCRWNDRLKSFGDGLAALIHPETGRLHPDIQIAVARTGRLSASRPNVQAMPKEAAFRKLFVPQPGHVFVRADYNQMQLRVAALLSGDARLLSAYDKGEDVHRLTAARVLGKTVEELAEGDRDKAKAIAFGILFGMGAARLRGYARSRYGVAMSEREAERIRTRFFEAYPDLRRWQERQVEEERQTRCSTTPAGRVRNFAREERDNAYTTAMNTPVQGGEAEVMLAALGLLPRALEPLDAHLVNCVHDEILCECPEEIAPAVAGVLRTCMEAAMRDLFPNASLRNLVEVGVGPNWGAIETLPSD